jgi:Helitron helicase-like domain at N-terminus
MQNHYNSRLHAGTMRILQDMLYCSHPAVQLYKQAYELTCDMPPEQQCQMALRFQQNCDRRRYQAPDATVREIAVIIPGDVDRPTDAQDIILFRKFGPHLQRILDSHPLYPSLRYVLLFPTGQLGWYSRLPYNDLEEEQNPQGEKFISLAEYTRYRLHIRPTDIESNHLFLSGKLFQEFVCEAWAIAEQKRLAQLRTKQDDLRVAVYQGLADAIAADVNLTADQVGKRFILPLSFPEGTRNMQQHCQDGLVINRYFEGGDLFMIITANPA